MLTINGSLFANELKIFAKIEGPPKHYIDTEGMASGYAVEIAVEAVSRAGYHPQVHNLPWNRAQQQAKSGLGVITAFSITEERKKHYLFTDPMYVDRILLWKSKENDFPFKTFDDLVGKTIGIARGSRYSGEFEDYRAKLDLYQDSHHSNRLRMLSVGNIDAAIFSGDQASVRYLANRDRIDFSKFSYSETPIAIDPNHIGIPLTLKGLNPNEILKKLNSAISEMKEDGTIKKIISKYL